MWVVMPSLRDDLNTCFQYEYSCLSYMLLMNMYTLSCAQVFANAMLPSPIQVPSQLCFDNPLPQRALLHLSTIVFFFDIVFPDNT